MDFESKYEISSTVDFIRRRNFTRVALQFPDELLKDSPRVAMVLRSELGKDVRLYVMADAAYGSCCVDEIGASHVNAECVVHYGHACMSPVSTILVNDYDANMSTFGSSQYDTDKRCLLKDLPHQQRILRRRYYLVEKAKDANIVGILVGTLGVAGYLHIIEQMKELIKRAGKKSYTLVMGRPNPAKLANFPECDVFVYVSCAQTALLDCKEFLAPVITPFEAVLAFSRGRQWTGEYVVNFQDLIASNIFEEVECAEEARFSFIKGGYMEDSHPQENDKEHDGSSLALTTITEKALSLQHQNPDSILFKGNARSGSEFFAARSYQGLNMQYENPAPPSYVMGRIGRAAAYVDEKRQAEGSPGVVD
ncbi:hypothetical protein ZIOFF_001215 [Zingiber officinale]|uniref:2-(3-amino-3-carboxypropyl)histidine synthase subunit 2 n=1 Tax=Zingiber officinale TaxID=94328 RepID=A0A8J5I295_ZINOF|nr:hypothetical protein ZIOFF_001215 [Zingiber officinale]